MARFDDYIFTDLSASITTKKYTFEVWVYSQTYIAGQFGTYSFEWNPYLKITIGQENTKYTSTCYPLYSADDTQYQNSNSEKIYFDSNKLPWVYLRCSVDILNKKYFHIQEKSLTTEKDLTTSLTDVITPGATARRLKFVNATKNRGLLYFRLMRLYKCYDCQAIDQFRIDWKTVATIGSQITNNDLIYHIDERIASNTTPIPRTDAASETLQKLFYQDSTGAKAATNALTNLSTINFYGYNQLDLSSDIYKELTQPVATGYLCPESTYFCTGLIKLNQVEDIKIPDVTPSYSGRYTMEFWTMITDITKLTKGFHIIWKNHATVSIVQEFTSSTNASSNTKMNMFCWPQDYKLSSEYNADIQGIYGAEIIALTNDKKILNYEKKQRETNINNTWVYIRCAVNTQEKVFYSIFEDTSPGTPTELALKSEILLTATNSANAQVTTSNDYPFRYFFQNAEKTFLQIAGMSKNTDVDIYLRNIYLFTEYLPTKMDFRHV